MIQHRSDRAEYKVRFIARHAVEAVVTVPAAYQMFLQLAELFNRRFAHGDRFIKLGQPRAQLPRIDATGARRRRILKAR